MLKKMLNVSPSPHIIVENRLSTHVLGFVLALTPAVLAGINVYGMRAVGVLSFSVLCALCFEAIFQYMFNRKLDMRDGTAILIGLMLGVLFPATVSWWIIVIADFLAIFLGRAIFGGVGANPFNPVLLGWVIISVSWPDRVDYNISLAGVSLPFVGADPLAMFKNFGSIATESFSLSALFAGQQLGGIAAAQPGWLLLGGLFLLLRGHVSWHIPISFFIGILVFCGILGTPIGFHLLAGMTVFGAFFLATDYTTSPNTVWGMLIYGFLAGGLAILIRVKGGYYDGVIFAILIMSMATPLFDRIRPRIKRRKEAANA